jgi:hypothetical protein
MMDVDSWVQTTTALIQAASDYAAQGVYDADTDSKIRRVRSMVGALQGALMGINIMPPPPPMPPPPAMPPPPMPAAPAPEATAQAGPRVRPTR